MRRDGFEILDRQRRRQDCLRTLLATALMQAQRELPADFQACKDKFLVQSVAVAEGVAEKDYPELFLKKASELTETKLKVWASQIGQISLPQPDCLAQPES